MLYILLFMIGTILIYTLFIRQLHQTTCPRCKSPKMNILHEKDHHHYHCKVCKFSFKDYPNYFTLTPIDHIYDIDFEAVDDDDSDYFED